MDFDSFTLLAAGADLSDEPAAREDADGIELRMDFADDALSMLDDYEGDLPVLVTNRVEWEGGEAPDDAARLDALETAVEHDAVTAVDVELAALEGEGACDAARVVSHARDHGASVVVSTHDFEATPDEAALVDRLERACEYGDVGKIATTARDRGDVLALLEATHRLTETGETVATMAMGEAGRHSRPVAPLYGSRIGYAPVDPADATAPGQYDLATLRRLVDQLS
ncbi:MULTISPECIES: type I 3-dehydroquinate dehydratase [Halomicrobium]|uniref:3-dehydroquinate dehydratase n=2 Tax=Halomicrobium mukohataei TaxID=57705 RepID=C7P1P8_HALMD|nr:MULTISPECIES: type I 3-dehydroquinate dehydratase [Halomicrobium]ACV49138.1 3-dehydroquinate dehydratase [Halomicrobium mukohataei DSM 12286]QCD67064.1 type I 3-dehydroquinate dehydratase [Halomicrobium mukohataei]QFR19356.1 type I 3-dehydroquinate dehydratase [Halomicrobium sp. ZPS1]